MRKPSLNFAVTIFTIFFSLSFTNSFSQNEATESKLSCADLSNPLKLAKVKTYVDNYYSIVKADPEMTTRQINFITPEMTCLAALTTDTIKFIMAAHDKKPENIFIVVEFKSKGEYEFYDLDDMFAKSRKIRKPSSHLCPPPSPCGVPFELR